MKKLLQLIEKRQKLLLKTSENNSFKTIIKKNQLIG